MPDLPFRIVVTDSGTAVLQRFAAGARRVGATGRTVGRTLSRGFGLAQGAVAGAVSRVFNLRNALLGLGAGLAIRRIVDTFGGFEKQMNTVRVLTQATTAEFEALTEQAKELGATTQFSARQAAEGMTFLAKAGFDANEVMQALPDTLTLAAAANLELAQSADIVTNILTGLQLPMEDLTRATDVLTQAFTSSNTDLTQLGQAFKFAGPIATTAGLEFEEVATILSFLGNAGIQASMAGTTLRGAIAQLLKPSREAQAILDKLGVTVKTADGNLRPFADIMEDLAPIAGNAEAILTIFGRRASGIASVLKQGSDEFRRFTQTLRESGGRAAEVASVQMQGLTGAIRLMTSAIEGAVIEIGDQLAPSLINAADAIALFGQNVGMAISGISEASRAAGEASTNAFLDFIPSAEAIVRTIQGVRRAWIGLSIAANLVERTFLEVALFINRNVFGPIRRVILRTAELIVLTFNSIRRDISRLAGFVVRELGKLIQGFSDLADELPGKRAAQLRVTFQGLAQDTRILAKDLSSATDRSATLSNVQQKLLEDRQAQREILGLINNAIKENTAEIEQNVAAVNALDNQTSAVVARIREQEMATQNQTAAIKENTAAKQAAAAAPPAVAVPQTIAEEEFATQISRVSDLESRFAAIGPNAAAAAAQFQTAFQVILDAPGATAEQFAPLEQQLSLMEQITAAGEGLPEAIRMQFDEAIPAMLAGQASLTDITAQALEARRQLQLQNAAQTLSVAASLTSALGNLAESGGEKNFETVKKFRIAEAIINGAAGVSRAFAELPFPLATAAAAAIAINTIAQVRKIQATQPGGGGGGGGGGVNLPGGGGGGGGGPTGVVVPAEPEEQARGQQITISVAGFIGNEAELASQLSNVIREAQGDGVDFALETSRG